MSGFLVRLTALLGRVCLALIFFVSAWGKATDYAGTVRHMTSQGVPYARYLLAFALLFEVAGGLMVLLGWRARLGAILLIAFLVPTTIVFHGFWSLEGAQRTAQMLQFLKNLSILGGLLLVTAYGGGPSSVDARRRR